MAKEKVQIQNLSLEELRIKNVVLEEQIFKLRMQKVTGQLVNSALLKAAKKELARVKTIQTKKQG